ncbi:hypothetical protein B1no1_22720 [Thermolongibacillus altinsuensis]|nr:hypothetical protein B1no1_22720 [Thermolongibacillus altinsuensis]
MKNWTKVQKMMFFISFIVISLAILCWIKFLTVEYKKHEVSRHIKHDENVLTFITNITN